MSEARAEPPVSNPAGPSLSVTRDGARELYRLMALTRVVDQEATSLQRQGELAVYPQLVGQEAAQVGSAAALGADDWIFPSYRELGAALVRGIDMVEYLAFYRATWHGGMWDPMRHRFAMVSVPVASQLLHAVGYAMGARLDGRTECALAYFGDGATSQGDFHEACNFAGVFRAPVIFFCQNNQWAISRAARQADGGADPPQGRGVRIPRRAGRRERRGGRLRGGARSGGTRARTAAGRR